MNKNVFKKIFIITLLLLIALVPLSGCGKTETPDTKVTEKKEEITVFAAASLTESLEEIKPLFEEENPDFTLNLNFDSSSRLRTQIEQGVDADIFLSANEKHFNILNEKGLVKEGKKILANKVVCIVPSNNPAGIENIKDLEKDCKFVIAQKEVPIGNYTLKILAELDVKYGNNYKEKVLENIVSEENNVKQVVSKVVLGEADAAFVYNSDVTESIKEKVKIIEIPEDVNVDAFYWAALLENSKDRIGAQKFFEYLTSEKAQKIFKKYGFRGL